MAKRKTFDVQQFKARINSIIEKPMSADTLSEPERKALCVILEEILMDTGNYNGYGYPDGYHPEAPGFSDYRRRYY